MKGPEYPNSGESRSQKYDLNGILGRRAPISSRVDSWGNPAPQKYTAQLFPYRFPFAFPFAICNYPLDTLIHPNIA